MYNIMVKTVKRHRVKTYRPKTKKSLKVIKKERACESIKCPVPEPRLVSIYTKEELMAVDKMPAEFRSPEKYMNYLVKSFKNITKGYLTYETKDLRNNFYNFINKEWLKHEHDIQEKKYYTEIDNFRIVQEQVYYKLIGYVKDYIANNKNTKKGIALKNMYTSLTTDSSTSIKKNARIKLAEIDDRIKSGDMYSLLADTNKNEVVSWASPIVWQMQPDEKNVKKYISHLGPPKLGLYDYMLYIDDYGTPDQQKFQRETKVKYFKYIKETLDEALGPLVHEFKAEDIWEVENAVLDAMGCNDVKIKEDPNNYNPVSAKDLEEEYGFDWPLFTKKMGFKAEPKRIIVSGLNVFKCLTALVKANWNTKAWRTYWLFINLKQMVRFDHKLSQIHYNFYGNYLEGQSMRMPVEIRCIFGLSFTFNTLLSEEYEKYNYDQACIDYVKYIVEDLRYVFIRKLKRNTWLSSKTRNVAIEKLEKLTISVGLPGKLREDAQLDYLPHDPWHNMCLLADWKIKHFIDLEGKDIIDIPEIDWSGVFKLTGTQLYMVNAYYRPTSNSIYVPLAYLQKPFIDLGHQRGLEYNLIYIGYTVGHELSHSLDDMGSRFDADGNLHDWWTDVDRKKYQMKINDIIRQYEEAAKRDGIKFDAAIGVGEDLADISGLALVEEYLNDYNKQKNIHIILKKSSLEKFYISLAIQGRQKIYKKAITAQLKKNPHPLEIYRTNCPLARLELFKTIYSIKKGDGMWWHNSDTIW